MTRWLPLFGLLFASVAFAGDPETRSGEHYAGQTWAGVRIDDPQALGLSKITPIVGSDAWQGAFTDRSGFVRVWTNPDEASARALFAFQRDAAATVPMGDLVQPGWDEAVGDGVGIALVRVGNVVLLVRDHENMAKARLQTVTKGLVRVAPPAPGIVDRAGVSRDSVGRQVQ